LRTVIWEQRLEGIPIFEAVLYGHISKIGELVSLGSQFLPNPAQAANHGMPNRIAIQNSPPLSAAGAVAQAAANIGEDVSPTTQRPGRHGPATRRHQKWIAQHAKRMEDVGGAFEMGPAPKAACKFV